METVTINYRDGSFAGLPATRVEITKMGTRGPQLVLAGYLKGKGAKLKKGINNLYSSCYKSDIGVVSTLVQVEI